MGHFFALVESDFLYTKLRLGEGRQDALYFVGVLVCGGFLRFSCISPRVHKRGRESHEMAIKVATIRVRVNQMQAESGSLPYRCTASGIFVCALVLPRFRLD